ncbi:serine/threonine protein kinase [Terribacillus aidingensis]|uniref:non-specific serine/threonine protein kinase n=1 Tax=Terribacillus aidingensis TaxID=586416 RepID=A0A285NYF2_9BACI|nr:protein kinase [Terribacillus aidingensis]SNZ13953.1 serine/threonine protein kinase [Terribacillus aidingensis]
MLYHIIRPFRLLHRQLVDKNYPPGSHIIGRYDVIRKLGSGSYGTTYLCKDTALNQTCTIKQLRRSRQKRKKYFTMFQREFELLQALQHPAIPGAASFFHTEDGYFFVMDYLAGENIEQHIFDTKKTYTEKDALTLTMDIALIVEYLHTQRIYHGDIRIPNVMLIEEHASLIDFGLAAQFTGPETKEEQLRREQDLFDLGDILLYLLYTTYEQTNKKALPWTEELTLSAACKFVLERLLGIREPFATAGEAVDAIKRAKEKAAD